MLALLAGPAGGVCEPLLMVAHGFERRPEERAQPQPELGLLGEQAGRLAADALPLRIGAVDQVARLRLGVANDQLGLP